MIARIIIADQQLKQHRYMTEYTPEMAPYTLGSATRNHHESSIQNLYQEFSSLKSQIYGSEEKPLLAASRRKASKKGRDKAIAYLQESKIRQCSLEFNQHLESIRKYQCAHHSQKKENQGKSMALFDFDGERKEAVHDFSKVFSKNMGNNGIYNEECQYDFGGNDVVVNVQDFSNDIERNEALFHQLINSSQQIKMMRSYQSVDLESIKEMFGAFSNHYIGLLAQVDGNIKFLNQKLKCLELIFVEFAKIKRGVKEAKTKQVQKERQIALDLQLIEARYENEIKSLTNFYEKRIKEVEQNYKQKLKKLKIQSEQSAKMIVDTQRDGLKTLLQKSKNVISTKQELIQSLQDQNEELRRQLERQSIERSDALRYSASTHKMKEQFILISQIKVKDKKVNDNNIELDDQINFSELGSVRDGDLSEWQTSQINLQHSIISRKSQKQSLSQQINSQE